MVLSSNTRQLTCDNSEETFSGARPAAAFTAAAAELSADDAVVIASCCIDLTAVGACSTSFTRHTQYTGCANKKITLLPNNIITILKTRNSETKISAAVF